MSRCQAQGRAQGEQSEPGICAAGVRGVCRRAVQQDSVWDHKGEFLIPDAIGAVFAETAPMFFCLQSFSFNVTMVSNELNGRVFLISTGVCRGFPRGKSCVLCAYFFREYKSFGKQFEIRLC